MAPKNPTTSRERTVFENDFTEPDGSLLGLRLGHVASLLTLLDDLHCDALQLDCSHIGEGMGQDKESVRHDLTAFAIEAAGRALAEAREALHDLFREVTLKPKAVV